jgi:hypothetical protein
VARKCIFCQQRTGRGNEHLFPAWLNGVFGRIPLADPNDHRFPQWARGTIDLNTGERSDQTWQKNEIASNTTNVVCHGCNTGWMAALEHRSAPLLKPMITGKPHTLTQADQIVVATWATKTVMVLEPTVGQNDNFPLDQHQIVMQLDRPPGLLRIRAAAIEDTSPPLRFSCVRAQLEHSGVVSVQVHFYTLQIGALVLQVIRPEPPPPNYGALKQLAVPYDIEAPVFPPVDGFFWPPKTSLNNCSLNRYVGRIESGTPPWE